MLYVLLDWFRASLIDRHAYWLFMPLDRLTFRALAAAAFAFFAVVLAGRPVIGWLRRKKIGDTGLTDAEALRQRAQSKANTPTMGGVLIVGAIVGAVLLLADLRNFYIQIALVVTVWLAALGGVDDWLKLTSASRPGGSRQGLFAWEKLVFQLGLGLIVGWFVFSHGSSGSPQNLAHVLNVPFQGTYEGGDVNSGLVYLPRAAFVLLAVLMIAGMSNAANISDGMDGLAAGVTAIVSVGLVVLTYIAGWLSAAQYLLLPYITQSDELLILTAAMGGACLGFLWWNCAPAQVFMGDTGSLCLGGLIAYTAVVIRQEVLVLLTCTIFLVEIGSVIAQVGYFKSTKGRRLFKCAPYHHHLHLSGWTEGQVVTRFWIVSAILVVVALGLIKVR